MPLLYFRNFSGETKKWISCWRAFHLFQKLAWCFRIRFFFLSSYAFNVIFNLMKFQCSSCFFSNYFSSFGILFIMVFFSCWLLIRPKKYLNRMTKPTNWLCTQQRVRSAWASTQSDQSLLWDQWVAKDPCFLYADSAGSDQTGWMPRLIWVFAGRTCYFDGFVRRWLICVFQVSASYLSFCPNLKHFIVNCEQNIVKYAEKQWKMQWKMQFLYKIFW